MPANNDTLLYTSLLPQGFILDREPQHAGFGGELPPGFVLDEELRPATPELPEGFVLDPVPSAAAELPAGFQLDPVPAAPVATAPAPVQTPGYVENIARGVGERGLDLLGGLARTLGVGIETAGDFMEGVMPLGRITYGPTGLGWERHTPETIAGTSEVGRTFNETASGLENQSLGYTPGTTWEDVKASPLRNFIPFALEQGLVSIPDMVSAVRNIPGYVFSRTGEMGQQRAQNDERLDATVNDLLTTLPAAAAASLLERIGTLGLFGVGEAALTGLKQLPGAVLKAGVKEAATEAAQEGLEYGVTTAGTKKGFDPMEAADRMAAGAAGGAGFGGMVRTGQGALEIATSPKLPEGFQLDPAPVGDLPVQAEPAAGTPDQNLTPPVQAPTAPLPVQTPAPVEPVAALPVEPAPVEQGPSTSFAPAVPAAPEPAQVPQGQAPQLRSERITTPDGEFETDVDFEVVEADQLKAAQGELQPRDRASRVGSNMQIQQMAARLDPLRLMGSRESDRGAPVVDEEGTILSGNGRVAAIMAAMDGNNGRYQAYRTSIEQMGFRTEGMKAPVLIRRAKGISPEDKRRFTVRSNSEGGLGLSPTERAGIEQDYVSSDMLSRFDTDVEGGVGAASNAEFVRQFLRQVPQNEQASFYNREGQLTPQGAQRIAGAIFSRAYGDKTLIERFVEDERDPAIRNALTGAAGAWARMRDAVKSTPLDITSKLVEAVALVNRARAAGATLENFTAQQDAFNQTDPQVRDVARLFYNGSGNRLAAWRDIRDRLVSYANSAERTSHAAGDIFGAETPTPDSILAGINGNAAKRAETQQAAQPTSGSELFSGAQTLSKPPLKGGKAASQQRAAAGPLRDAVDADPDMDEDTDPDLFGEGDTDLFGEDARPDVSGSDDTRAPRGAMAPKTEEVSFTNRASMYEEAFRLAGLTPDEGVLLPPAQKRNVLKRVLEQTFGFKVDLDPRGAKLNTLDAADQMLDAYRGIRFMMHVLELPVKAISLAGSLTLTLERFKGRYLGAYSPGTRTIHMPGRSNSFAHEWAHALDHFLLDRLKPASKGSLFSQAVRQEGVDPTVDLDRAFVNLVYTMFYDEADLAAQVLRLEQTANETIKHGPNAGQPTQAAETAREQIERLTAGATRVRIKPSKFRKDSADYSPAAAGYFASVHEMMARAFEAYVANRVSTVGGGSEFITKGEANYLGQADRRLAMTFPKEGERLRIFSAFDDLFHHIRVNQLLGTDAPATKPDDVDIVDPQHWNKIALAQGEPGLLKAIRQEVVALRNVLRRDVDQTFAQKVRDGVSAMALRAGLNPDAGVKANASGAAAGAYWAYKLTLGSYRGFAKAHSRANKGRGAELLDLMIGRVMTDPGSGENKGRVQQTYEQARERETAAVANEIASLLAANPVSRASGLAATTGLANTLPQGANETIRELLYGSALPKATANERSIAAGLRRIMDRAHRRATGAGIDVGYVESKGYLPRVLRLEAVEQDAAKFLAKAARVYGVQFDRLTAGMDPSDLMALARSVSRRVAPLVDPRSGPYTAELRALRSALAALDRARTATPADPTAVRDAEKSVAAAVATLKARFRPDYADTAAKDWHARIIAGDSVTYDSHGPDSSFTKERTLPPEADELMADFYNTDALDLVMTYAHNVASRAAYAERFGKTGGVASLDTVLQRQDVRDAVAHTPRRYDPKTESGRTNIIADLANPRTDNLLELALDQAARSGASSDAVTAVRGMVANITGRAGRDPHVTALSRVTGFVYIYTTLALLGRVTFASAVEPLTTYMRTGDVRATFATLTAYLSELNRSSRSVQERAAVARAIGLVSAPLFDAVVMNRLSLDNQNTFRGNVLLSTYFRATLLTQLTNAQRRAAMVGSHLALHHMGREHGDPATDRTRKRIIEADIRELGVPDADIPDFLDYLAQSPDLPNLSELDAKPGKIWSAVIGRMVDETIQNPRRADKPAYASNPYGRLIWHLTSFLFAFFRNVIAANFVRAGRNAQLAREDGASRLHILGEANIPIARNLMVGMSLLFAGQLLVTVVREWLLSGDQWEDKDDDERRDWLLGLALSRTGVFGPSDIFVNSMMGLKYGRDLTSLPAGVGMTYILSNVAAILNGLPNAEPLWSGAGVGLRNSPKTNTAEHEAAKAVYRLLASPIGAAVFASAPMLGPITAGAKFGALAMTGSNDAATGFADMLVGEREGR